MVSEDQYTSTIGELIESGVIVAHKDGNHGSNYPRSSEFGDEGVPFLTAKLVSDSGRIDFDNAPRLNLEKANKIKFGYVEEGDVLLSHNATVGRVALVPELREKVLIGTSLTHYRLDSRRLLPKYLAAYFRGRDFQNQLSSMMGGMSTRNQVPITAQRLLTVVIPPLEEQKAIAHILGSLDDKIELNRQMNATLEAMAQALFKSWFVDFDPVIDNALAAGNAIPDEFAERAEQRKGIEKKDNTDIQSLFPDEFEFTEEMGWIPKGWKMSSLTEVMDFLEGPGIRNWQYTEEEDGIKFINIRCIQDGDIKLATANKITKEEAFGKYEHFQLEVDDIVVSASGTLGRYAFVRKGHLPLSLNTSVIRFRPIEGISTLYYIAGYIDTKLQFELETRATGSAQRNFGPMHLKQISMLLPPINILEKHSEIAKTLFSKRKSNLEQIEALTKLRDTLLPKLMSGELRIPDAVALVENV